MRSILPAFHMSAAVLALSGTPAFAVAAPLKALSEKHHFDIPAQRMHTALLSLSQQSSMRILFPYEDVGRYEARAVRGWFSTSEALSRMMEGTPLRLAYAKDRTFTIAMKSGLAKASLTPADAAPPVGAAASAADPEPQEQPATDIIVTGTRTTNRTVVQSLAPIDVLTKEDMQTSGKQSVRDLLGTLVPSINVSNNGGGASWAVRSLSLRGLGGDQVLVLVNGKRRHNTATLFINGTVQNGQSPPDLDLIPGNAISRIEVLRDGASAQYGSDAIAGVINVILKKEVAGGVAMTLGGYTDGGGEQGRFQFDHGLRLGNGGHLHVSVDGVLQDNTITPSSPIDGTFYFAGDPRNATVNRIRAKYGQPQVAGVNTGYDAAMPVGDALELYSFGTFSKRHAAGWLTYRLPSATSNIPEIYPDGYIPRILVDDEDYQLAAGARGEMGGIHYDLSTTYSSDKVDYNHTTSLNASLGPASPTSFYLGKVRATEWTTNLDLQKSVELGLFEPLSVAVGAEYRQNGFAMGAGEPASYVDGGYVSTTGQNARVLRIAGAQGVTGFLPTSAGHWSRDNWSLYGNIEGTLVKGIEIGLAGRHESYSDFGTTNTGKASVRVEPIEGIAIRGTASTGFRAPTLQQQHYSSSSTIVVSVNGNTTLLPVQALPVDSAAAIALGATSLKPERSTNYSLGLVLSPARNLNITVDAYQVKIADRILLSESLTGTLVRQVLANAGIPGVAGGLYFSNAADTRTRGLDIVGTWRTGLGDLGRATFSLSANFNETIFTHVDPIPSVLAASGLVLVGRARQGGLSKGTPRDKFIANVFWEKGPASINVRATRYGTVTQVASGMVLHTAENVACAAGSAGCTLDYVDDVVQPKALIDLEVGYQAMKGIKFSLGANNLFNIRPSKLSPVNQIFGLLYNQFAPYGISGGLYYARLNFSF